LQIAGKSENEVLVHSVNVYNSIPTRPDHDLLELNLRKVKKDEEEWMEVKKDEYGEAKTAE
jgi:hypothetical protein